MFEAIIYGSLIAATGILSWVMAALLERRHSRVQITEAHQKLKQSETKSHHFQNEFARVQKELQGLKADFQEKNRIHEAALSETRQRLQGQSLRRSLMGVVFGLMAGGFLVGAYGTSQAKLDVLKATMDLQVRAQVAEARLDFMNEQNRDLRQQLQSLRAENMAGREQQAVAMTKFNILLHHMQDKKNHKLGPLDLDALKLSLQVSENQDISDPTEMFPLPIASV